MQVDVLQVQLEQDSGKSIHEEKESLIDLNRSGIEEENGGERSKINYRLCPS